MFLKSKYFFMVTFLFLYSNTGCFNGLIPEDFKKSVKDLKIELQKIDLIPVDEKEIYSDDTSHYFFTDVEKRKNYVEKNIIIFNDLFDRFTAFIDSNKQSKWYDDALFCRAYGALSIVFLSRSDDITEKALSYLTDYIDIADVSCIENWTKKQFNGIIWNKYKDFISDSLSDEMNFKQFFYIARASIWEFKKQNKIMAIKDYENALAINMQGLWAKQAQMKIKRLKNHLKSEKN